ncbi:MAG TPA: DUF1801 domain-containing protein [Longimicrobiaceae bacterium]|nr:DUF1801 domain-containing protein [Longimicrobiaceae bacterium]
MSAARRSRSLPASTTPDEILAPFPADVQALARELRHLVRSTIPGAEERPHPGWRALGYRDEQSGWFCGIFPFQHHVRIYFGQGAALRDPEGLLEGKGKQVRHVEIRPGEEIPRSGLEALLEEAVLHGAIR